MAEATEFDVAADDSPLAPRGHRDYDAEVRDLGLKEYCDLADEQGFAVVPPEKVAPPEFIERLRNTVLRVAEERTGQKFSLEENGN